MKYYLSLVIFFLFNLCQSQILLDVDLSAEQQTEPINFTIDNPGEMILYINASSNTSWTISDSESSILEVLLNNIYHQDIVLYNGQQEHTYKIMLGYLQQGDSSFHQQELLRTIMCPKFSFLYQSRFVPYRHQKYSFF